MPLTTSTAKEKVSDFETEWEGEPIKGKYRPGMLTGGYIEASWERPIQDVVSELCVETDIMFGPDDMDAPEELRGKPVPMDDPALLVKHLPREVLYALFRGIFNAAKKTVPNTETA